MLRDKEYVYAVYQERCFSKAAKKLFVSQPTLSTAIRRVERRIGLPLFDRSTNPIQLTEAGEYYIGQIERIIEIEREMTAHFSQISQLHKGRISIGGSAFFCIHFLSSVTQKFQERYPGYSVNLVEGNVNDLIDKLSAGEVDFTVDVETLNPDIFELRVIEQEHIVLAAPSCYPINSALAPFRLTFDDLRSGRYLSEEFPPVDLAYLQDENFILLKKGNDSYTRALRMCQDAGFTPHVVMYLDQLLTSYYIAAGGKGVAFIRAGIARHAEYTDKLYFYKINHPLAIRNINLYYKRSAILSQAARDFLGFLDRGLKSDIPL